jgi:hypothetical protein
MKLVPVKHVTVLIADQLSTWSRVLSEELTGSQVAKKFPVFHGN